jgi:nitrate reductase NapAB chaperone NapD
MSRLELEGEQNRLRRERLALVLQVPTKAKALKDILDKVPYREVKEIDFEGAVVLAVELKDIKEKIGDFFKKEMAIEKELNG